MNLFKPKSSSGPRFTMEATRKDFLRRESLAALENSIFHEDRGNLRLAEDYFQKAVKLEKEAYDV